MNENQNPSTVAAVTPPAKEKLTHKERKARWRAAKKAKKEEQREYYRYAPPLKRAWHLWLGKTLKVLLILAIIFGVLAANMDTIYNSVVIPAMRAYYNEQKDKPLTEDKIAKIYELSPIDEKGNERIEALPAVGADETWTVCVYFVAADLEDDGEDDLSIVTSVMTKEEKENASSENHARSIERLNRYTRELKQNGLELPKFFYYPDSPVASSVVMTKDVHVSDRLGFASSDIMEMTSGKWGDNIQIVMQTGGATHWSNSMINPNRTQRFLYKGGKFLQDRVSRGPYDPDPLGPRRRPLRLRDGLHLRRNAEPEGCQKSIGERLSPRQQGPRL